MLYHYAVHQRGPLHVERGKPCQDAYAARVARGAYVAGVADGVGTARHAERGARAAVQAAVQHCVRHYRPTMEEHEVLDLVRKAYCQAFYATVRCAARQGDAQLRSFDTTLCLALYDGVRLFWGQAGDSGLVVAHGDGTYELVTRQQRDQMGRVRPLRFGPDFWKFGVVDDVASFLLATDGVLEHTIAPPVLASNWHTPLNRARVRWFLHPRAGDGDDVAAVQSAAAAWFSALPEGELSDDRTLLVVCDDEHPPAERPAEYYDAPDWERVRRSFEEKLSAKPDVRPPAPAFAREPATAPSRTPASAFARSTSADSDSASAFVQRPPHPKRVVKATDTHDTAYCARTAHLVVRLRRRSRVRRCSCAYARHGRRTSC